jgi:hypothetical protein
MGLAVIDTEHCLSWLGLRCEVCFRACPVQGQAITLTVQQRQISKHAMFVPVVHSEPAPDAACAKSSAPPKWPPSACWTRPWCRARSARTTDWAGSTTGPCRRPHQEPSGSAPVAPTSRRADTLPGALDYLNAAGLKPAMSALRGADPRRRAPACHAPCATWAAGHRGRLAARALHAGRAVHWACCCCSTAPCTGLEAAGQPLLVGNLSAAQLLGTVPLADPFAVLQMLVARHPLGHRGAAGCRITLGLYALLGGRVFCAWVCPMNVVTDAAAWLRAETGCGHQPRPGAPAAQHTLRRPGPGAGGVGLAGAGSLRGLQPHRHAAPRTDLRRRPGPGCCVRHAG